MTPWLIIPVAFVVLIVAGLRVLRGKYAVPNRKRDEACRQSWERAKRGGFILHCFRTIGPIAFAYFGLVPFFKSWRETGVAAFARDGLPVLIVSALITTLIAGAYSWALTRAEAREAQERLQAQDERGS